jgi:hypothetical protein
MQHVDNATYYLDACRVIIFYRQDHAPYGIKKKDIHQWLAWKCAQNDIARTKQKKSYGMHYETFLTTN